MTTFIIINLTIFSLNLNSFDSKLKNLHMDSNHLIKGLIIISYFMDLFK